MRALVVNPGPNYSVKDVANGWTAGLVANGVDVQTVDLEDVLTFFSGAYREVTDGQYAKWLDIHEQWYLTSEIIKARAFTWWPDVVISISSFFVTPHLMDVLAARNMRLVHVYTESPYEDDNQLQRAQAGGDLVVLNDPINLDKYRAAGVNAIYLPHSYDPTVHKPGPVQAGHRSDVCIIGSGYKSRVEFLSAMRWDNIDLKLLGNWTAAAGTAIEQFVHLEDEMPFGHPDRLMCCVDNIETVTWYQSTDMSMNLYRREANRPDLSDGWAMGPREVELAACGTFYITQPRGENVDVLPSVPKFNEPGEAEELIRFYLANENARAQISREARSRLADWTFKNRVAEVLRLLDRQPVNV